MPKKGFKTSNVNVNKLLDEIDEGMKETDEEKKKREEEESKKAPSRGPLKSLLSIPSYKKGGKVKKTGLARLHKGERVIPKKKSESMSQFVKRRNKEEMKGRKY